MPGGNIIFALSDGPGVSPSDLQRDLGEGKSGDELILEILRDGDRASTEANAG